MMSFSTERVGNDDKQWAGATVTVCNQLPGGRDESFLQENMVKSHVFLEEWWRKVGKFINLECFLSSSIDFEVKFKIDRTRESPIARGSNFLPGDAGCHVVFILLSWISIGKMWINLTFFRSKQNETATTWIWYSVTSYFIDCSFLTAIDKVTRRSFRGDVKYPHGKFFQVRMVRIPNGSPGTHHAYRRMVWVKVYMNNDEIPIVVSLCRDKY